jgi:ribosomal RNA-processing protein 36
MVRSVLAFVFVEEGWVTDINVGVGEKRDLLLKGRFEDLQKRGGQKAVKKAVEKKRKKVAGKEKKSRPFARGQGGGGEGGDGGQEVKRRRVG